jgi:hypothetical protein
MQASCQAKINISHRTPYLEGQPEGLVGGSAGGDDGVEGLEQGHAAGLALLPLDGPALGGSEVGKGSLNRRNARIGTRG